MLYVNLQTRSGSLRRRMREMSLHPQTVVTALGLAVRCIIDRSARPDSGYGIAELRSGPHLGANMSAPQFPFYPPSA